MRVKLVNMIRVVEILLGDYSKPRSGWSVDRKIFLFFLELVGIQAMIVLDNTHI